MGKYQLTYFNLKGRAEPIRYMFALAGVEYEDVRINPADWGTYKAKTPFGYMPILKVDGKQLVQSGAINRYLARKLGFLGNSDWDAVTIDMVHEIVLDLVPKMRAIHSNQDPKKKEEAMNALIAGDVTKTFDNLEKILKENNGGDGFFVGDKISFADITVFNLWADQIPSSLRKFELDNQPKLKNLMEKVKNNPNLTKYIEKREKENPTPY